MFSNLFLNPLHRIPFTGALVALGAFVTTAASAQETAQPPTSPPPPKLTPGEASEETEGAGEQPADGRPPEESSEEPSQEPSEETSEEASEQKDEATEKAGLETADPPPTEDDESWLNLKASSASLEKEQPPPKPHFRTMVLVQGTAQYGGLTIANPGTTLEESGSDVATHRMGHFGAHATLGVMPGGGAFTMAGRLRGGSYVGTDVTQGNIAAEMLFGANFARNARGTEFTYVLGGFGVEFLPRDNQDMLTLNVSGGTVVKGVAFGAGFHVGANDQYALAMFGMHIGWGQLF